MKLPPVFAVLLLAACLGCTTEVVSKARRPEPGDVPRDVVDQLETAETSADLIPFLGATGAATRIAAVRRAKEIGGPDAISLLTSAVLRDELPAGPDPDVFRAEAIKAIGEIGGDDALEALLEIHDVYAQRSSSAPADGWRSLGHTSVLLATVQELGRWRTAEEVAKLLADITSDETGRRYTSVVRELACTALLNNEMDAAGVASVEARADYLMDHLTGRGEGSADDWIPGRSGVKTQAATRNSAIVDMLVDYGTPVLPLVEARRRQPGGSDEYTRALGYVVHLTQLANQRDQEDQCAAEMRMVVEAILLYAKEHDGILPSGPDWKRDLMPYLTTEADLQCPSSDGGTTVGYELNPNISGQSLDEYEYPDRVVCLYEALSSGERAYPHGGLTQCAFLNGRTRLLTEQWDGYRMSVNDF